MCRQAIGKPSPSNAIFLPILSVHLSAIFADQYEFSYTPDKRVYFSDSLCRLASAWFKKVY